MRRLIPLLALLLLAIAVFSSVANFGYVDYDDPVYLNAQPYVMQGLTFDGLKWAMTSGVANIWHPLTWASHMLDVTLFGENWGNHHLVNLAIHLASGAALYCFVLALFPGRWGVSLFTTAVFLIHPLHVESVAWLSERKDTLSGLFFHLTLLAYVHYTKASRPRSTPLYLLTLILYLIGLTAKPSILILPALLMLIDLFPLRRKGFKKLPATPVELLPRLLTNLPEKIPFIALSIAAAGVGFLFQKTGSHAYWMGQIGLTTKLTQVPAVLGDYLRLSAIPTDLSFTYPRPIGRKVFGLLSHLEFRALLGFIAIVLLSLASLRWWKKLPEIAFGWLWFLVCLALYSGILYVGSSFTNDRYTYLALTGPTIALALLLSRLSLPRWLPAAAAIAVTAIWSFLSFQQTQVWKDNVSLFSNATRNQPLDPTGWVNLGSSYEQLDQPEIAEPYYLKALEIQPEDYTTHHNLAQLLLNTPERRTDCIAHYEKAIEIYPLYHPSLHNLGMTLTQKEHPETYDLARATDLVNRACEATRFTNPLYASNLVDVLGMQGEFQRALDANSRALSYPHIPPEIRAKLEAQRTQITEILSRL